MKKYIKNNTELKKIILDKVKSLDKYRLKVLNYSSYGFDDEAHTDLEVHILENGEYYDSVQVYGLETKGDFIEEVNWHIKGLKGYKNTTYKYLCKHFENVEFGKDFSC